MKLYTREQFLKIHKDNFVSGKLLPTNEGQEVALKDSIIGKLGTGMFNIGKYLVGKIDYRMKLGALRIKSIQYAKVLQKALDEALAKYQKEEAGAQPSKEVGAQSAAEEDQTNTEPEESLDDDISNNVDAFITLANKFKEIVKEISSTTSDSSAAGFVKDLKKNADEVLSLNKKFKEQTETYSLDKMPRYKDVVVKVEGVRNLTEKNYINLIKKMAAEVEDSKQFNVTDAAKELKARYLEHKKTLEDTSESLRYITEGVITNLADALTAIDLKKYPKDDKFKDMASSLVDRRALKLITYEAMLITGGTKENDKFYKDKDIDKFNNDLYSFWERQMLLIDKNYQDYIDMDDVRKNVDVSTLTEKDQETAMHNVGVVTKAKKNAGHTIIKSIDGLKNQPIVIQVFDSALKTKLYNIVCTYIGTKDDIKWFKLYNVYAYNNNNGKWIESELIGRDIKERAGNDEVLFCMQSTSISNNPKPILFFNEQGMMLGKTPRPYNSKVAEKIKTYKSLKQMGNNYSFIVPACISCLFKIDKTAITTYELSTTAFSSNVKSASGLEKARTAAKSVIDAIETVLEEE